MIQKWAYLLKQSKYGNLKNELPFPNVEIVQQG